MKVTKKEMAFLKEIVTSDFSYDGFGFNDYITHHVYDMRSVRGLIPHLVEKNIINYDENCGMNDIDGKPMAWAEIREEYSDMENHKLIGLEVA